MSRHSIRATYTREDPVTDAVLTEIEVRIWFNYTRPRPASYGGEMAPIEPAEPALVEFVKAEEEVSPFGIPPAWGPARPELSEWAQTWLDGHEDEAIQKAIGDHENDREHAAELRRES